MIRSLAVIIVAFVASPQVASAQDAAAGEKAYAKCRTCHQIGPNAKSFAGPELNGLFGRKAASVTSYPYSPANKNSAITWTEDNFRSYIKDPKAAMPGTKMVFAGLKDDKEISDLIAYLKQFKADGTRAN